MATSKGITTFLSGQVNVTNFHYTINEITEHLSALSSAVENYDVNTPPTGVEGATYIIGGSPTGDWAGQAKNMAHFYNSSWHFYPAFRGMLLFSITGSVWRLYDGSNWSSV